MLRPIASSQLLAVVCVVLLAPGDAILVAQQEAAQPPPQDQAQPANLTPGQLDALVAPIALYPDPLISKGLVASTYPLEIVQASQWIQKNPGLKGAALVDAAKQQNWDSSVQAMVVFPDTLKRLNENIRWTASLGNAFLAQQPDVLQAIQRLRFQAQEAGKLQSNQQQNVTTETQDGKSVVVIQPAQPQTIYVPTYNPEAVWGPPPASYPYPPLYYPSYSAGAVAAGVISFGAGIALGAAFSGCCSGGWGWGSNWGHNNVMVNNNFVNHYGYRSANVRNVSGNTAWSHNPAHRQGVPYSNSNLANQYRGNVNNNLNRSNISGNLGAAGQPGQLRAPGGIQGQAPSRVQGQASRGTLGQAGLGQTPGAAADKVGNRNIPRADAGRNANAFSGMGNGAQARVNSDRGLSSLGSQRASQISAGRGGGGGFAGGGGGRMGGGRMGGGGRRR